MLRIIYPYSINFIFCDQQYYPEVKCFFAIAFSYDGLKCDRPCDGKTYGLNCREPCNCENNAPCDPVTGNDTLTKRFSNSFSDATVSESEYLPEFSNIKI